jgi:hypothetical protein
MFVPQTHSPEFAFFQTFSDCHQHSQRSHLNDWSWPFPRFCSCSRATLHTSFHPRCSQNNTQPPDPKFKTIREASAQTLSRSAHPPAPSMIRAPAMARRSSRGPFYSGGPGYQRWEGTPWCCPCCEPGRRPTLWWEDVLIDQFMLVYHFGFRCHHPSDRPLSSPLPAPTSRLPAPLPIIPLLVPPPLAPPPSIRMSSPPCSPPPEYFRIIA